jgi:acetyl-CoA C-acetyltransferase
VPLDGLDRDEHPRPGTTAEKLASLKPAFAEGGTITAGNASGINDGAAMLVVCDEAFAKQRGWTPLAFIGGWSAVGCDPKVMGLGPVHATRRLCASCSGQPGDFDAVEINEAFAAQALACVSELRLDEARVNPHGGAIALGHPIGASGARLVTHLAHRVSRGEVKRGLATLCVGGGMGVAMAVEREER